MKSATGRWVSGEDFFGREAELEVLGEHVRAGNHILLTGQRRMGKTSIARELGRRLGEEGWIFLFVNTEMASSGEDVTAQLAEEVHPIQPVASRLIASMRQVLDNVDEVSAAQFRLKVRAGLTAGNWRRYGEGLLRDCGRQERRMLIVLDELPIFLARLLRDDDGDGKRVDEFLSWLRATFQTMGDQTAVLMVSGSIGLAPLVGRLGMSDRINYLHPFRVGPWSADASVACLERLAESHGLALDEDVAATVHGKLGLGIPQHVQSFFAHLRDDAKMRAVDRLTLDAVERVYRSSLLGPWGQGDLKHYESRLHDNMDELEYRIAMDMLTEAATQGTLTSGARRCLEMLCEALDESVEARTGQVLEVLEHDGYLEATEHGHRFASKLLGDWWRARFEHGYVRVEDRLRQQEKVRR